jgi:P3 major capsid protein
MATPNVPVQAAPKMTPQQQDAIATRAILSSAVDRVQNVASAQVFPASNPVLLVQPLNVGLIKRFTIVVSGHISNTGTTTLTLTDFGLANLFGQGGVQYVDLNNYLRVNTSGAHLSILASAKRRRSYGATVQDNAPGVVTATNLSKMLNVAPATWGVFQAPQTIATGTSGAFRAVFELPLSYTDDDLRGAIWANVLNAVQQLTLTFNPQAVTAAPIDNTFAVYAGPTGSAGSITDAQVLVYQEYLDQLPKATGAGGSMTTILPALSISTVYELKSTVFQNIPPNQEFYIPYANQRSFVSTILTFNHDGSATGRVYGTDVTYWALVSANSTYIWKLDPLTVAMRSREHLMSDLPAGAYYLPSRRHNIASLQFGNLQATLNANTSTASGYINAMWEMFALQNTLSSGASLASS